MKTKFYWDPDTVQYYKSLREEVSKEEFEKAVNDFIYIDCHTDNGQEEVTTYPEMKKDFLKALI
jgi:hypothetical protein